MIDTNAIVQSVKEFPPFPEAASRALKVLDDPDASVGQLISIVEYDQSITANVLKICNSAYYGLTRQIRSLREGLVLLGNSELKNIVLASTTAKFFQKENKGYALDKGELWKHAVACAIIARIVSNRVGRPENPSLFTGALLHDMGKVVLDTFVDRYFEQIIALVKGENYSFLEAESKMLGINHAEVGAKMAESWNFPDDIVRAIRLHHAPEEAPEDDEITALICLANIITLSVGVAVGRDGLSCRGNEDIMKRYGLKATDLQQIVADFYDEYDKVQDILRLV